MNQFIYTLTVKHDQGTSRITTIACNIDMAIRAISVFENCTEWNILNIKIKPYKGARK